MVECRSSASRGTLTGYGPHLVESTVSWLSYLQRILAFFILIYKVLSNKKELCLSSYLKIMDCHILGTRLCCSGVSAWLVLEKP